jgi:oligopeptidase B
MSIPAREANPHTTVGGVSARPPVAERRPVTAVRHGHIRTDDYAWLRADNWQQVMRDPPSL